MYSASAGKASICLQYVMLNTKTIFIFQLYELSDDVKRKEFLDDLFAFMQKRGKKKYTNSNTVHAM